MSATFAAVDLGATSGRVITGTVGPGTLGLTEVHRFSHAPLRLPDGLHWDITGLYANVLAGLRKAGPGIASIGVDTWAVDYGLLDAAGELLGLPYSYRDGRTASAVATVHSVVPPAELYARTGLQHLPFNTVFQLAAERGTSRWSAARKLLLLPDLLTYWLTGTVGAEETNASTTGLFDAAAGTWSDPLISRLGLDRSLFPPLRRPGDRAGTLLPHVAEATGLPESTPVVSVASHDTASAVAAVPIQEDGAAFISCGTWSLAGLELDAPVLTEESRAANFTNERGVDGTTRYLRNIMGMWLLEECRREWGGTGLAALLDAAAEATPFTALIDPDDPVFLAPGDMPARIAAALERTGQPVPRTRGGIVRCVLESLALAHRRTLREAAALAGRPLRRIHLVGGAARNALLCQWTADATGLPVTAGPAEATALGNLLLQARAHGVVDSLSEMRALVAENLSPVRYEPRDTTAWDRAAERLPRTA
ncbi:rhamnulokinase [Streptomyces sclerotialus]|uniref:rhamnulokinase n=1 Tax=Streptomyces sclerotialus TaxID=1957 RepID=UPI0004C80250